MKEKCSCFFTQCLALAACIVLASGCAGGKDKKSALDEAEQAINNSESAKECAEQSYEAAKKMLDKAREAARKGDEKNAKLYAMTAKKLAEEAQREAETNQEDCLRRKQALVSSDEEIIDENAVENTGNYDFKVIYFDFDEYNIPSASQEALRHNTTILKNNPNLKVILAGHTDDRGTTEYNLALSLKRAESTRSTLSKSGIEDSRMKSVPYGKEKLQSHGNREQDHALNRRVEFMEQ